MRSPVGDKPSQGTLKTLWRGIHLLEVIARSNGSMTVRQLSHKTGINMGTCYQIIRTLYELGYIARVPGGRYTLGPRIGVLVEHYDYEIMAPPELIAILDKIFAALDETTYLAMRRHNSIVLIAARESTRPVRVSTVGLGYSNALHARASCKAILAYLDDNDVRGFFRGRRFTQYTPSTYTTLDALRADLKETRARGYAIDREEVDVGVANVAVPIFDSSGEPIGAYSVGFVASSLPDCLDVVVPRLQEFAKEASNLDLPPQGSVDVSD